MSDGRKHAPSPFHAGEREAQERRGVRAEVETLGRRVIHDHMPAEHRAFYARLPFLLVGTVDAQGRPWASLLAGPPGFIAGPDPHTLEIAARPLAGDPLAATLEPGADIGILGIDPETRRRNRVSGRIASVRSEGFTVRVRQAFGNCPQYIQRRSVAPEARAGVPSIARDQRFDDRARVLIARADTLFIATAYSEGGDAVSEGADVSHRGGKPGFVRVEDDGGLVFPDFAGNNHFNTLGNILGNPKAGLLFVDFETGETVSATGAAEIVWDGPEVAAFAGAERLLRFRPEAVIRVEGGPPLRFDFVEYSPTLERTGSWADAREAIAAEAARDAYLPYEIFDARPESATITSFYLRRTAGEPLPPHEPGQFLPIRLAIPGRGAPVSRTYTLSEAANGRHYRLSIKREEAGGLVSNFLHDRARPGFRLEALAPRGKFVLDRSSERPVVLLSAGVGITPMIAMLDAIVEEGRHSGRPRRTYFIHGARDGRTLAFAGHLRELAARHDDLTTHIRFSRPGKADRLGETHDSEGHIDLALLKRLLAFDDHDFYLCGPVPFMQALYDGLTGLGVREARIHYEAFGPSRPLRRHARSDAPQASPATFPVRFAASGLEAAWTPQSGTLLELAEATGLAPPFACRSGVCGSCTTRLERGRVDYREAPSAPLADDEVLICAATPDAAGGTLVLDL